MIKLVFGIILVIAAFSGGVNELGINDPGAITIVMGMVLVAFGLDSFYD